MRNLAGSDNGLVSSNNPIPSIEHDTGQLTDPNYTMSGALNSRDPTVSVTPPFTTVSGELPLRGSIANIDQTLGAMRLSDTSPGLGMSDVAAALDAVAGTSGAARDALSPSPPPGALRPGSRRRSSSRVKNVVPHDIHDEKPPLDRFHEPGFRQAFANAKRAMADLRDALGSGTLHTEPDSTMQQLHVRAGELSRFQCPSARIVGFVGDSGVGR